MRAHEVWWIRHNSWEECITCSVVLASWMSPLLKYSSIRASTCTAQHIINTQTISHDSQSITCHQDGATDYVLINQSVLM